MICLQGFNGTNGIDGVTGSIGKSLYLYNTCLALLLHPSH